ncbi:MAG TPA: 2-hydroxyacyl-CoA dehydratase family protein [Anaerolineae bacterium]|nr:2-hydroxyacyl-CoA dehydratase family protein [Anaerolineae bacterium]HPL27673.1 2-hydroxyacyl-CoA dehydratase family protein [Anaerolineae bacterium]
MLFDLIRWALANDRFRRGFVAPALRFEILQLALTPFRATRAERLLAEAGLRLSLRAFEGREAVIYTSLFTPPELLHALGVVPFGLEAAGAGVAALGLAPQALAAAERAWAPVDACSILRAGLGVAYLGLLPRPQAVVATSSLCDSTPKVMAAAARLYGAPFFLLDVPYEATPPALAYLAGQLEDLTGSLAAIAGRAPDPARLTEAVRLSNEARGHLDRLTAQRVACPGVLPPGDGQGFLYPINLLLGSPAGATVFRAFAEEAAGRAQRPLPHVRGPRVLLLHVLPYFRHHILDTLQAAGACVVFEEMSQVYWPEMDPSQPYLGLARRCIAHFDNGPLERRTEAVLELARRFAVDGALHFSPHGCRQSWGALQVLRDALAAAGMPLLELEGDCVDARGCPEGQQRTRLMAFVEALGQRTGEGNRATDERR